tara:strand:+ start:4626 stop:5090 length:465 start_codon:yes stop_codon:yes gene_type:complete
MKQIIFCLFFISFVTSVFSQKNLIKSFFRGDNGIQYFIKPIVYQTNNKEKLSVDFTLNVINDSVVKIISNFSSLKNNMKKLIIGSSTYEVIKLFDDYETKKIYSRYTFDLKFRDFKKLFLLEPIIINYNKYFLKKSFRKRINLINENFISKLNE